ncbi:MAG: Long-chain-fatty-acid--CoA ligase FadD15 [Syntrophus sp. PtaU1.Bin208]|nr:MAG: Long-chain-fatty-acid--CoA ligase FadD15 [Syntrophus sp. PtaU1.Bin208]
MDTVVLFDHDFDRNSYASSLPGVSIRSFAEIMNEGVKILASDPGLVDREIEKGNSEELATIIFTSGTTGEPKGVMICHRNFLHQVKEAPQLIDVGPEDVWLCVLPVWHSFERIMQYIAMGKASALAYSKPIGKIMLADCQKVKPTWMASVPRIWESFRESRSMRRSRHRPFGGWGKGMGTFRERLSRRREKPPSPGRSIPRF